MKDFLNKFVKYQKVNGWLIVLAYIVQVVHLVNMTVINNVPMILDIVVMIGLLLIENLLSQLYMRSDRIKYQELGLTITKKEKKNEILATFSLAVYLNVLLTLVFGPFELTLLGNVIVIIFLIISIIYSYKTLTK